MRKTKKLKEESIKRRVRQVKGITLIALVITIIVLLILAGVTIATLTGENGILTRANEAKTNTEQVEEDELKKLTALEAATNLENTTHIDNSTGEEKTVTIPAGFAVSKIDGENTIADGLVIIDKNGNEFVWIPVDDINIPYQKWCTGGVDYNSSRISDDILPDNIIKKLQIWYHSDETITENLIQESILKYHGFYIARYDAGIPENSNQIISNNVDTYNNIRYTCF